MGSAEGVKIEEQVAAAGQPNGDPGHAQATADGQPVPYERFKQVNEAKNKTDTENAVLREQLKIMAANPQQNAPQSPEPGQGYTPPDYLEGLEIDDDEAMSGADVKKAVAHAAGNIDRRYAAAASALQFQVTHSDYAEVVGTDGAMAPALVDYLQKNPLAMQNIRAHPNPTQYLYTLGKAAKETKKAEDAAKNKEGDGKKSPAPGSPSLVGSGAHAGTITAANRFAQMSKEELEAYIAQVKSQSR